MTSSTRCAWRWRTSRKRRNCEVDAMRERRRQAYPELIRPGAWKVVHQDRGGHTIILKRELSAPLDDSDFARGLRLHELAHVKHSPARMHPKLWRVDHTTLLAVEDARVNELVCRAGMGDLLTPLDDPAGGHLDPRDHLRAATLLLTAAHGTGAFPRLWAAYASSGAAGAVACNLARRAIAIVRQAGKSSFRDTIEAARFLDRALGTAESFPLGRLCCVSERSDHGEELPRGLRLRRRRGGGKRSATWGRIREVQEPPRPIRTGALPPWRHRATAEGSLLRSAYRLLLDGRVFSRRQRLPGGTVLVDGSGSMSLDRDAVMAILEAAPAALVARYDADPRENVGIIRILARGGRRVADEILASRCCGSGNVVDGPALRWLATRPGPRVWVSDGGVTGLGDEPSDRLTEESRAICQAHGIVRVEKAEEARKILEKEVRRALSG
jgi:hypothetical protein